MYSLQCKKNIKKGIVHFSACSHSASAVSKLNAVYWYLFNINIKARVRETQKQMKNERRRMRWKIGESKAWKFKMKLDHTLWFYWLITFRRSFGPVFGPMSNSFEKKFPSKIFMFLSLSNMNDRREDDFCNILIINQKTTWNKKFV